VALICFADFGTWVLRVAWADYFDSQGVRYAFFSAADATAAQEQAERQRRRELGLDDEIPVDHEREMKDEGAQVSEEEESEEDEGEEESAESDEELEEEDEEESDEDAELNQDLDSKAVIADSAPEGGDKEWQDDAAAQAAIAQDIASRKAAEEAEQEPEDPRTRVLTVLELEELFESAAPPLDDFITEFNHPTKLMVGLVGYPNVGKSSTINALLGSKKVSVSATPGKTKHFQTLAFSNKVTLCDCPGLVFPQFVNTEAELVCDGVLPIDQMREVSGPIELICRRIPREILEGTYGIRIDVREVEDGGTGRVGWEDLLSAYASKSYRCHRLLLELT
jgi:large subunit GTPase 1